MPRGIKGIQLFHPKPITGVSRPGQDMTKRMLIGRNGNSSRDTGGHILNTGGGTPVGGKMGRKAATAVTHPIAGIKKAASSSTKGELTMEETKITCPCEYASSVNDDLTKEAADFRTAFGNSAGAFAGTMLAGAALAGGAAAWNSITDAYNRSDYDRSLQEAIRLSPSLQMHGYQTLKAYMPMIIKASPTVAREPRLLANYLESMLDAEGHMNLATFGELSALEGNILKNRDYNNTWKNYAVEQSFKAMADGAGKGISAGISSRFRR